MQSHSIIVAEKVPVLLHREWLCHLNFDWMVIGLASFDHGQAHIEVLLNLYEEVFKDDLGAMRDSKATLTSIKKKTSKCFARLDRL